MLWNLDLLRHYRIGTKEGSCGRLRDLLFDDRNWAVRHVVAGTGILPWSHEVLLAPSRIEAIEPGAGRVRVGLSRAQVEASPSSETDKPASRWRAEGSWTSFVVVAAPGVFCPMPAAPPPPSPGEMGDPHLRSARELAGYRVVTTNGKSGRVADCLVEQGTWRIRYLAVKVGWWPFRRIVLVASRWITRVSWRLRTIEVGLHREVVVQAPSFVVHPVESREAEDQLAREYEELAFTHGRQEADRPEH